MSASSRRRPLVSRTRLLTLVATCFALAGTALVSAQEIAVGPMVKTLDPSFEVATIKKTDPSDQNSGFHTNGHRIYIENETMLQLLTFAYGLHSKQIVDAPGWFTSEHWDIRGVPDREGQPDYAQQQSMLRKLLAERFGLRLHRDHRDMSMYAMTVVAAGKLTPNTSGDNLPDQTGENNATQQDWRFTNNSMADFAQFLHWVLERPVVDRTGLTGRYDFHLKWANDDSAEHADTTLPGFFTAAREQAGLKIEPTHGQVEVVVIEAATLPQNN